MEQLYQRTGELLRKVSHDMSQLEHATKEQDAWAINEQIYQQMNEIEQNCRKIDELIKKEPEAKRKEFEYHLDQLKFDHNWLNASLNALNVRLSDRRRNKAERDLLLHQRFKPNETSINLDSPEFLMNEKVKNANRGVDDLLEHGNAVLKSLRIQSIDLEALKRKVFDIGRMLGVSNTTMRLIERRVTEDWIILCVGCIFVFLFMYFFYQFWKG